MRNYDFDLFYFIELFKSRSKLLGTLVLSMVVLFSLIYFTVPKKFKSAAQITIYSKYFQNPLIKDFISEQYDPSEMRNQREALLQQSLDDAFVDQIGDEFKLYQTTPTDPKRGFEREELRKHFEIISLSADSYQVGFIWNTANTSFQVAQKTLTQVVQTLVDQRRKTITNVRNAIRARMEAMVLFMNNSPRSLGSTSRAQVEEQLEQIRSQIKSLLEQYKEKHPKVVQLRAREAVLAQYLNRSGQGDHAKEGGELPRARTPPETLAGSEIEPGSKEVYQDLLKKYNYLNVALDMEKADDVNYYAVVAAPSLPLSAAAPKFFNFFSYGLACGILLALFVLLYDEFVRFSVANAEQRARFWGIPLLGTIPPHNWNPNKISDKSGDPGKQPNDWN